jgi:hypothetical protein
MSLEMVCGKCGAKITHPANKNLVFMEGENTSYPEIKVLLQQYSTGDFGEAIYLIKGFWVDGKVFPITEARINMAACAPVSMTLTLLLRHLEVEIQEVDDEH